MHTEIYANELWERPFTTRRCLHPPCAEEMATMWPQFAYILGDIYEDNANKPPSAGMQFLWGEEDNAFPFKEVSYKVRQDGIPVHAYSFDMGDWSIRAESFCDIQVSPTIYTKVTVKNKVLWPVKDVLGLICRTGLELCLHGMSNWDGYNSFSPNSRTWGQVPRTWSLSGNMLTDGKYTISFMADAHFTPRWQGEEAGLEWHRRGILKLDFSLQPGEECVLILAFKKGTPPGLDYEAEKEKVHSFWEKELSKIKIFPGGDAYKPMIKNLVAQMLQMFCHHVGKQDYLLPRQGGLQRNIWVCEAYHMLMALDRIGDFSSYTERCYDLFYDFLFEKEGENRGMIKTLSGSIPWGGTTGSAMCGVSYHMLRRNDKEIFDKFKDRVYASFQWIEAQRKKSAQIPGCAPGIMPPLRSCDWEAVDQFWIKTDLFLYEGMLKAATCFENFGDARAAEIRKACEDYKKALMDVVKIAAFIPENSEEMMLNPSASTIESMEDPLVHMVNILDPVRLATLGILDHKSEEMINLTNYFKNRNLPKNGLHNLMHAMVHGDTSANLPWFGYTYYTTWGDDDWFYHYLAIGDKEKAAETLKGTLKFSMTKEFYCCERYAANDPYYVPWTPNASANARIIAMLCTWFGEE